MSSEREIDDAGLEALFATVRAAPPPVPDALMARVLADAAAAQPASGVARAGGDTRPAGWLGGLLAALGGRAAAAGLVAAGLAGVWIGFVQPVDLAFASGFATADTVNLYPADLDAWSEVLAPDLQPSDPEE